MTRLLDRYIFKQLTIASLAITAVLVIAAVLTRSLTLFKKVVSGDLPLGTFIELIFLLMPSMIAVILPISVFAATIFIYEKISSDSELVILRATGVSPLRLSMPAYLLALISSLFLFSVTFYFMPASYSSYKNFQRSEGVGLAPTLLEIGTFKEVQTGVTAFIGGKSDEGYFLDVIIHDERKPEAPTTVTAKKAEIIAVDEDLQVVLYQGVRQTIEAKTGIPSTLAFERIVYQIVEEKKPEARAEVWSRLKPKELFVHELAYFARHAETKKMRNRYSSELHNRFSMPLLVIGFVAVGLSILLSGDLNRRNTVRKITLTICVVSSLQILALLSKRLTINDGDLFWTMYLAAFLPIIVSLIWPALVSRYTRWNNRRSVIHRMSSSGLRNS
jgi:lipopolysaccharide export system permease protein